MDDVITPESLREAAEKARELDDFLQRCNEAGAFKMGWLVGFDLDWLAQQFDTAATDAAEVRA